MNRVTVSLVAYGPLVLDFQSGANSFLSNVLIAVEKLNALGYDVSINDMGKSFFINVR